MEGVDRWCSPESANANGLHAGLLELRLRTMLTEGSEHGLPYHQAVPLAPVRAGVPSLRDVFQDSGSSGSSPCSLSNGARAPVAFCMELWHRDDHRPFTKVV